MRHLVPLLLWLPLSGWAGDTIKVAVAANFKHTLETVNADFESRYGHKLLLSSASTGVLYSQILHGAPFDIFFAADTETPAKLASASRTPQCYARGSLVLAGGSDDLQQLADQARSLAIANPNTAPYGRAALEVLARPEFAAASGRKLVRGSNVVQAFQFWYSGGVDLALVPRSLAPAAAPIPLAWYRPLEQHVIVLHDSEAVTAYLNWVRSDSVRSLINNAGYEPCP